jgi:hypothetical protein
MNGEFGSSPAFFEETELGVSDLMDQAVSEVFPHHHEIDGEQLILNRCLAAMVFHQQAILHLPPNHAARSNSFIPSVITVQQACHSCPSSQFVGDKESPYWNPTALQDFGRCSSDQGHTGDK